MECVLPVVRISTTLQEANRVASVHVIFSCVSWSFVQLRSPHSNRLMHWRMPLRVIATCLLLKAIWDDRESYGHADILNVLVAGDAVLMHDAYKQCGQPYLATVPLFKVYATVKLVL